MLFLKNLFSPNFSAFNLNASFLTVCLCFIPICQLNMTKKFFYAYFAQRNITFKFSHFILQYSVYDSI